MKPTPIPPHPHYLPHVINRMLFHCPFAGQDALKNGLKDLRDILQSPENNEVNIYWAKVSNLLTTHIPDPQDGWEKRVVHIFTEGRS